jgi:hypothetical protein
MNILFRDILCANIVPHGRKVIMVVKSRAAISDDLIVQRA